MILILILSLVLFAAGLLGGMGPSAASVGAGIFLVVFSALFFLLHARSEERAFRSEYRQAERADRNRGYYPEHPQPGTRVKDVSPVETHCVGCSTGYSTHRLVDRGAENQAEIRARFTTAHESEPAPRHQPAPEKAPDVLPVHPRGAPIPAPDIFYPDKVRR